MGPGEMPPVSSVCAPKPVLKMERFAGFDRLPPRPDVHFHIVRVNELRPAPVSYFLKRESREIHPLPVEIVDVAFGCGGGNILGHRFNHEMKPRPRPFNPPVRPFPLPQRPSYIVRSVRNR